MRARGRRLPNSQAPCLFWLLEIPAKQVIVAHMQTSHPVIEDNIHKKKKSEPCQHYRQGILSNLIDMSADKNAER
jgi:hypothetical protein